MLILPQSYPILTCGNGEVRWARGLAPEPQVLTTPSTIDLAILDRASSTVSSHNAYRYSSTTCTGAFTSPAQKEGDDVIRTYPICRPSKLAKLWSRNVASNITSVAVLTAREWIASLKALGSFISSVLDQEIVVTLLCGLRYLSGRSHFLITVYHPSRTL